eukprot:CAMPEP_0168622802 /NCGR_PEP_ID=MMETSP0449_2-20121227/8475_1 /TAXON_ID=1082188 /ORGANISM="Strombidium rassoulzadegani, Strain ras09" /LENGTH=79 /DNA_ID=CAMNT_0008664119 /DNA_START=318 /DNA_END=557 /DNA_ORIENTATION=-
MVVELVVEVIGGTDHFGEGLVELDLLEVLDLEGRVGVVVLHQDLVLVLDDLLDGVLPHHVLLVEIDDLAVVVARLVIVV